MTTVVPEAVGEVEGRGEELSIVSVVLGLRIMAGDMGSGEEVWVGVGERGGEREGLVESAGSGESLWI